jgi:hypothetical protein
MTYHQHAEQIIEAASHQDEVIRLKAEVQLLKGHLAHALINIADLRRENLLLMRTVRHMGGALPLSMTGGGDSR